MPKRLSIEQIEQMKAMVLKGTAPEDIAAQFNIAVSSVHNYKNRFKEEGLKFPNIRGRRPQRNLPAPVQTKQQITPVQKEAKSSKQVTGVVQDQEQFKFIVNGVSVQVSGNAKSVNINKDSFEVNF